MATPSAPPRAIASFTTSHNIPLISFYSLRCRSRVFASNEARSAALAINGGDGAAINAAVLEKEVEPKKVEAFKVSRVRPCELYVCNLPRSVGIDQLLDLFRPYGTVSSVEISQDTTTGLSRGCGYVTMSSVQEAKAAIAALDKSDIGGRELRVRFSGDMGSVRNTKEAFTSRPKRVLMFESPYRIYVGNLAWTVKPEDLRQLFSQYGMVTSARLQSDRNKVGRRRAYGFVSFSNGDECKAAVAANGKELHGRTILVREVTQEE